MRLGVSVKREHRYGYRHSAGPLGDGHLEERHSIGLLSGAVDALVVWTHVQFLLRLISCVLRGASAGKATELGQHTHH